jgi:hypothetical protein
MSGPSVTSPSASVPHASRLRLRVSGLARSSVTALALGPFCFRLAAGISLLSAGLLSLPGPLGDDADRTALAGICLNPDTGSQW